MAEIRVIEEGLVGAPAALVYVCLADYRQHHPKILPPAFSDFRVEEGGVGAGTIISYKLAAGGRARTYRMEVSEPEPGKVLVERDLQSTAATTFTVTAEGQTSRVRFETVWQGAGGIGGFFERMFAPRVLKKLYAEELARLDQYARTQAAL